MQNIKLHEATKQFNITNKLAMFFLEKHEVPVKSHSSAISMEQLELLRSFSKDPGKIKDTTKEYEKFLKEKKKKPAKEVKKAEVEKTPEVVEKTDIAEAEKKIKEEPVIIEEEKKPEAPPVVIEKVVEEKKKPEPVKVVAPVPEKPVEKREEKIVKPVEKVVAQPKPAPTVHKAGKKLPERRTTIADLRRRRPSRHGRRDHRGRGEKRVPEVSTVPKKEADLSAVPEMIQTSNFITLKELGEKLNIKLKFIEDKMMESGVEFHLNQFLNEEEIKSICSEFNVEVNIVGYEEEVFSDLLRSKKHEMTTRPPVVTVMGHVDHGKTTLLDTLRKTRVVDREAGGITQKIGAYKLKTKKGDIVFIDTPGHEAFTNLRARGAKVTDIVVLVVAANDGVKPQTIEAINHAKAAGAPLIVAINKIDLDGADANKVKQELTTHNIVVEDWGGDVVSVDISAKNNTNLDSFLEMVSLVADMLELKSYKDVSGWGTVIEARLDPKLGPVGTVLVQEGRIKRGDFFISGNSTGKIRSLFDDAGKTLNEAVSPAPVEVMGFEVVPEAGERFQIVEDISKANKVIELRKQFNKETKRDEVEADKKLSLQNLFQKMDEKLIKEFPIVLKTDNFGSGEILVDILMKMGVKELKVNVVHKSIGNITDSDVLLAATSGAVILGFNVKAPQKVLVSAKREGIEIKLYSVIYHLIEELEKAIKGEIDPVFIESQIGKIEVLQKFKISKLGNIAGCIVREGKITNKSLLKVMRGDDLVFEGEIETLKRVKDEVKEVNAGTECGIKLKNFNTIEIGDFIEVYELKQQ